MKYLNKKMAQKRTKIIMQIRIVVHIFCTIESLEVQFLSSHLMFLGIIVYLASIFVPSDLLNILFTDSVYSKVTKADFGLVRISL